MIDADQITTLIASSKLDLRPVIAITMRACGCTYQEIGDVLGITRAGAERIVKKYDAKA